MRKARSGRGEERSIRRQRSVASARWRRLLRFWTRSLRREGVPLGRALAPARVDRPRFHRWSLVVALVALSVSAVLGESLDWNASGSPTNSFELTPDTLVTTAENTCDGSTVTATFSDPDGAARVNRSFPDTRNSDTGNSQALWWLDGGACNDQGVEVELVFGGNAVENLAFSLADIDGTGGWIDEIVVTAEFVGALPAAITCGDGATPPNCSTFVIDAPNNTATGTANNNPFDDLAGQVDVVIAGPVQRVTIRYQAADTCNAGGNQVSALSGFTFDCSALPVTLASFRAQPTVGDVRFDWTTATETGNVGFYLYGEVDGDWRKLDESLVPSHSFDSLVPQSYTVRIPLRGAERFALAEVDRRGEEKLHGPFEPNVEAGSPIAARSIDWDAVHREAMPQHPPVSARGLPQAFASHAASSWPGAAMLDLHIKENGLYRVGYEDLAAAGFELDGVAGSDLALVGQRKRVPIHVVSGGEVFAPGDYFEFFGEALDTLYTRNNVYQLIARPERARRVTEFRAEVRGEATTTYVDRLRVEENHLYSFASPVGDPWFDRALLAFGSPKTETFDFEIDDVVEDGEAPELTVELWGVTDWPTLPIDHHVTAAVNGVEVASVEFDGLTDATFTVALPADLLAEGRNTLELTLPGDTGADFDLVHVEGFRVVYPRNLVARDDRLSFAGQATAFTVDGLTTPNIVAYVRHKTHLRRITEFVVEGSGTEYRVTFGGSGRRVLNFEVSTEEALRKPAAIVPAAPRGGLFGKPVDYLIISHSTFANELGELVAAREAEGYRVRVVDVARVFSRYSSGIFDPEAIREYIAAAVAELGVEQVLLVGGDSYDYHDYLGVGSISFVPTIYAQTHAVVRYSPSDSLLADVDGDGLQDLAIGRLPVRTVTELETVIEKTLQYSPIHASSVFAADATDGISSFSELADRFADGLGPHWNSSRAYIDELGFDGARDLLLQRFDEGSALVSYVGHSSAMSWTFDGLFTNQDALALSNGGSPAVVLQWGCWNGYHSVPEYDTLGHSLLLTGPAGAAAVVGASTLTEASADEALALEMYPALSVPGQTLGGALLEAKRRLAERGGDFDDVIYGMTVLGDPALVIQP